MKFNVELSEKADQDLRNIFLYIAIDLCSPEIAEKQINRLWNAMRSLDKLPERYRRYEDEPWHIRGMRVLPVDKYIVLYIPNLKEQIVQIISIMYSGHNISEQLKQI